METCKTLGDYAEITYRIRKYAQDMTIESAVKLAVSECIREDILKEFLLKNRAEAESMWIFEYDEEKHMQMERKENYEAGFEDGRNVGFEDGQEQLFLLMKKMNQDGLQDSISRLATDSDFFEEM